MNILHKGDNKKQHCHHHNHYHHHIFGISLVIEILSFLGWEAVCLGKYSPDVSNDHSAFIFTIKQSNAPVLQATGSYLPNNTGSFPLRLRPSLTVKT
jgi:hypothetical protein